jgi:excisionase family DNA binding protein
MDENQRLLDPAGVATQLGFGAEHVRRLIRKHAMPAKKFGRNWRITEGDLKEWIEIQGGKRSAA